YKRGLLPRTIQKGFNRNINSLAKWIEGAIQRFRSGVKNSRVIELHNTCHYVFIVDEALGVREMSNARSSCVVDGMRIHVPPQSLTHNFQISAAIFASSACLFSISLFVHLLTALKYRLMSKEELFRAMRFFSANDASAHSRFTFAVSSVRFPSR